MLVECQLQMLKVRAPSLVFQFICFKRILNSQVLFVSVKASFFFVFSVTFQWMQCCPSATGKLLKNALQSFSLFFGIKVCFVWMLMFICPKLNCPQVLFFVRFFALLFFFLFLLKSFFSPCALPVLRRRLLFFQFFSSPPPRLSHNPGMFFPKENLTNKTKQWKF